jgi:hypothetical protein
VLGEYGIGVRNAASISMRRQRPVARRKAGAAGRMGRRERQAAVGGGAAGIAPPSRHLGFLRFFAAFYRGRGFSRFFRAANFILTQIHKNNKIVVFMICCAVVACAAL